MVRMMVGMALAQSPPFPYLRAAGEKEGPGEAEDSGTEMGQDGPCKGGLENTMKGDQAMGVWREKTEPRAAGGAGGERGPAGRPGASVPTCIRISCSISFLFSSRRVSASKL